MTRNIYVYISINQHDILLGTVFVDNIRGKETYSFAYSEEALKSNLSNYLIDEEIAFTRGRQFKINSSLPYHFLEDSSPDRWGRNLIKKNANSRNLQFSDYLLGVSDISRMGAIRYKEDIDGPFLLEDNNIPPLEFLDTLEEIAYHYDDFDNKNNWKILLSPGSSLGGARPKATFYDSNKNFYLAKFNHKNDDYDVSKIEYLTYRLAIKCGIEMMDSKLISLDKNRSVFLTKRFDRDKGSRFHYVSFMTLLNANDGESNEHSYIEVVEALLRRTSFPNQDLEQLFRRIAFSIIFHNYDNHLRNHGLLLKNNKWKLSPCFDINISPYPGEHALSVDGNDVSIQNLIDNANYFKLDQKRALEVVNKIKEVARTSLREICKEIKVEKELTNHICEMILND